MADGTTDDRPTAPDVTVVVAVYNPGANIDGLLESLRAQSLGPGRLEVVLVDDGSTDGTLQRLESLATTRPYLVVRSIPNSGWPGRPRNVGLDVARGEFVFFADHDDEFFPESLARMVSMARQHRSDIVYGKVVRTGRPTPYWPLARHDVAEADPAGDVLSSRTVHKLYRRQWLLDLGARFLEGRVRLEDHTFTAQVLPHARVVSVLASYPCYRWIHRPDGTNSSETPVEPDVYWEFYSGVLRVFEREAGPGHLLQEARRHAALQSFSRFSLRALAEMSPEDRSVYLAAVHRYVQEQVPASLDESLPVLKRLRLQALRDGGTERFLALHEASGRLTASVELAGADAAWADGRVLLHARSQLVRRSSTAATADSTTATASTTARPTTPDTPAAPLERVGDDVLVPLTLLGNDPSTLSALSDSLTSADRRLLQADRGSLELTVRHRTSGVEWPLVGDGHSTLVGMSGSAPESAVTLQAQVSAALDPTTAAFGRPLEEGIWDVLVRSQFLGENRTQRLPVPAESTVVLPAAPVTYAGAGGNLEGRLYRTSDGTLALKVADPTAALARRPRVTAYAWDGDRLTMHLVLAGVHEPAELALRVRGAAPGENELVATVDGGVVSVDLTDEVAVVVGGPVLDVFVRPAGTSAGETGEQRVAHAVQPSDAAAPHPDYSVYATSHGSLSLKRLTVGTRRRSRPVAPRRSGLKGLFGR